MHQSSTLSVRLTIPDLVRACAKCECTMTGFPVSDDAIVLAATRRAQGADSYGAPTCAAVRALCPALGKTWFDAAAVSLAAAGRVALYHHDAAAHLGDEEREQLVTDGVSYYNMMRAR